MSGARTQKGGFTLLEVLVASLLLGMLVTILTMVFNQSSIAWRIGKAGVADLDRSRRQIALIQRQGDNVLPFVSEDNQATVGRAIGIWDQNGTINKRAVEEFSSTYVNASSLHNLGRIRQWEQRTVEGASGNNSAISYIVMVVSKGPDGQQYTADDISTWPQDK